MNFFIESTVYRPLHILLVTFPIAWMPTLSTAHDGESPTHYVADAGIDEGSCDTVESPCKTLDYALTQAEKGDTVLVAEGNY